MKQPIPRSERVVAEVNADRLDIWLHDLYPDRSRSFLQKLIKEGHVRCGELICESRQSVRKGETYTLSFPPPKPTALIPDDVQLQILYEDPHLIVIDKPASLVVHPGAGHAEHTLVHALLHHCKGQLSGIGGVERPGIVHRLDKDTSGCLVVAKTDPAHRQLAEAFQNHTVEKIYLALVEGVPRLLSGKIDQPIGRHPVHRQKMAINTRGKDAVTHWKIREKFADRTLLECRIETGRTHQIRVHLAYIHHPVVGDSVYGSRTSLSRTSRQMLHAWKLRFRHPVLDKEVSCVAPIPQDMALAMSQSEPSA